MEERGIVTANHFESVGYKITRYEENNEGSYVSGKWLGHGKMVSEMVERLLKALS